MYFLSYFIRGHTGRVVIALAVLCVAGPARAVDFNGDGIDDLLFRDRSARTSRIVLALGERGDPAGGALRRIELSDDTTRVRGFDVRTGDFDGDGMSDLLMRDLVTGTVRVQLMNATTIRAQGLIAGPPRTASAALQAVADFDGDGRDDLLMRDRLTGTWSFWLLNGLVTRTAVSGSVTWAQLGWELAGVADFDGDGRADLLLHRSDAPGWRIARMNGRQALEHALPEFLPEPQWQLESIADMNRDGRADLLFRSHESGAWQVIYLAGTTPLPESGSIAITDTRVWQLQLLDDLNGDGYPDALLERFDTGELRVDFLLQRRRLTGSGIVARVPDLAARIVSSGDYDGDGVRAVLVARPAGWQVVDLRSPAAPRTRPLDLPPPRNLSEACEPPRYQEFVHPDRPSSLDPDVAFLTWKLPTTRKDGEPLCSSELAALELHYSRIGGGTAERFIRIGNPRSEARQVPDLGPGTWWFRLFTVDTNGERSDTSATGLKTVP